MLVDYDADYRLIYYTPGPHSGGYYGGATVESVRYTPGTTGRMPGSQISTAAARRCAVRCMLRTHGVVDADFTPGTINGCEMPDDWPSGRAITACNRMQMLPDPAAGATIERPHRRGEYDLIWGAFGKPILINRY